MKKQVSPYARDAFFSLQECFFESTPLLDIIFWGQDPYTICFAGEGTNSSAAILNLYTWSHSECLEQASNKYLLAWILWVLVTYPPDRKCCKTEAFLVRFPRFSTHINLTYWSHLSDNKADTVCNSIRLLFFTSSLHNFFCQWRSLAWIFSPTSITFIMPSPRSTYQQKFLFCFFNSSWNLLPFLQSEIHTFMGDMLSSS